MSYYRHRQKLIISIVQGATTFSKKCMQDGGPTIQAHHSVLKIKLSNSKLFKQLQLKESFKIEV